MALLFKEDCGNRYGDFDHSALRMGMFLYDNPERQSQPIGTVVLIKRSQKNKVFNLLNDIL